jgi:hypothetical protein
MASLGFSTNQAQAVTEAMRLCLVGEKGYLQEARAVLTEAGFDEGHAESLVSIFDKEL